MEERKKGRGTIGERKRGNKKAPWVGASVWRHSVTAFWLASEHWKCQRELQNDIILIC